MLATLTAMQCFPNLAVNSLSEEHLTGLCFHGTTFGKHCPMLYLYNLFRIFDFSPHSQTRTDVLLLQECSFI